MAWHRMPAHTPMVDRHDRRTDGRCNGIGWDGTGENDACSSVAMYIDRQHSFSIGQGDSPRGDRQREPEDDT